MKYSLTKKADKEALVELFMMLSDSLDENIPDIIWQGSEFEVDIKQPQLNCTIDYVSTKNGGEFSIKVSWITQEAKKQKAKETAEKTKEKLEKGETKTKSLKTTNKETKKPIELVSDEELWLDDEEEAWTASSDDGEWDSEDYDEEW
jgi:predicted transglutaminase-like cysteine proteinase